MSFVPLFSCYKLAENRQVYELYFSEGYDFIALANRSRDVEQALSRI
jgi:hypothetical protein